MKKKLNIEVKASHSKKQEALIVQMSNIHQNLEK